MRGIISVLLLFSLGLNGGPWYMRVVARDDTAAGQEEKIRVRDEALACFSEEESILAALPRMAWATRALSADARVGMRIWAPEGYAPAPTVYITLGAGNGHNWWGVLCDQALEMAGAEETDEPNRVEWVWPGWDWIKKMIRQAFGGEETPPPAEEKGGLAAG